REEVGAGDACRAAADDYHVLRNICRAGFVHRTMRLYHVPRSRSTRVLWLLEELGAPYDLTVLAREDRQTPEHRERHPLGRVPVLEDEHGFVFESAALCLHLADLH